MSNEPGLDKNYFIAIALSMLILMGYPVILKKFFPPKVAPAAVVKNQQSTATADHPLAKSGEALSQPDGPFIEQPEKPAVIQFENEFYDIQFSTLGGSVSELHYKGVPQKRAVTQTMFYSGDPSQPGLFGLRFAKDPFDLSTKTFKLNRKGPRGEVFEFMYEKAQDFRVIKKFTMGSNKPSISLEVTIENLSPYEKHYPLELIYGLHYHLDTHELRRNVEVVVSQDKIHSADLGKVLKSGFFSGVETEWAGVLKKYFALLVKPDGKIISVEASADKETLWSAIQMAPVTVPPGQKAGSEFFIYAGPQQYETLKSLRLEFENVLSRGFFGLFKIWLLIALKFLDQFTHNYGWAIILLTIALKGAFTPLTHMSYESMKKMQAIQPKLKSIQERYKNDPAKLNKEMMELYKRNKVNPMGGCLPMLAQIPIFIAFYQVLNETIELKGAPFMLWITDLAEPDRLFSLPFNLPFIGHSFNLLPFFMIASMIGQQKLTPQAGSSPEQAQMMAFTPLIFGVLFYNMPSGLVLYWFVNNVLTVIHQLFIKRMVVVLHHEDRDA